MKSSIAPCSTTPDLRAQRQQQMSNEISQFSAEVEAYAWLSWAEFRIEMLAASTQLGAAADDASSKDNARAEEASVRSIVQCARHSVGRGRTVRIGQRNRPAGRAVQRHRHQGGERSGIHQYGGARSWTRPRPVLATWSSSSPTLPSKPICSHLMRPSKPRARARPGTALPWWREK